MKNKSKVNVVLVTAMLLISFIFLNSVSSEDRKTRQLLPEELLNLARQSGYVPIADFYKDRPDVEPPFVYGYLPGPKEDSAAFWCQKTKNKETKYFLVFLFKNRNHELCNCPDIIEWQNYPGGLSIYKDTNATLDRFVYITDPKRKVPKNVKLTNNAVRSYYDGLEEIFYCYKGEWLVRMRD
jgi:hypothetical protein